MLLAWISSILLLASMTNGQDTLQNDKEITNVDDLLQGGYIDEDVDMKISNGASDQKNLVPFVVRLVASLKSKTDSTITNQVCSGTLITPRHVLTLTACIRAQDGYTLENIEVILESRKWSRKNQVRVNTTSVTTQSNSDESLGIVNLPRGVIPLPIGMRLPLLPAWNSVNKQNNVDNPYKSYYAAGWGDGLSTNNEMTFAMVSRQPCTNSQDSNFICIAEKKICQGDIGGPLLASKWGLFPTCLAGVATLRNIGAGDAACAGNSYISVSQNINWIRSNLRVFNN